MNPVFVIVLIIWIIRALTGGSNSGGTVSRGSTNITPAGFALILKLVVFFIAFAVVDSHGGKGMLALQLIALPLFFPALFLQWVIVPLGMHRLAYWTCRCTWPFGFGKETRLGAVFYGMQALARKGGTPEKIEWLLRRLPPQPNSAVAFDLIMAMAHAMSGDRDAAQLMFHSIDTTLAPAKMRRIARDWLMMDAVRSGDWQEALLRGIRTYDTYAWSHAVARLVQRMDRRDGAYPDWRLIWLWLIAPRRLRLLPYLRLALATPRSMKLQVGARAAPGDLPAALADLAAMLIHAQRNDCAPDREEFLSIIRWLGARAESPAVHLQVQERLRSLDPLQANRADEIIGNLRQQIIDMVVPLIEQTPLLVAGEIERPIIKEAVAKIREAAFQTIETRCRDYVQRTQSQSSLEPRLEWGNWAKLRALADRVVKLDPQAENAMFAMMYGPLCGYAVFLHNTQQRHRLAHDMFRWLRSHAQSNTSALELLAKNMAAYDKKM